MRASASARAISAICIPVVLGAMFTIARAQEQPTTPGVTSETTTAAPQDEAAWRQRMDARMQQLEQEYEREPTSEEIATLLDLETEEVAAEVVAPTETKPVKAPAKTAKKK